jgi:hypothetical protein
MTFLYNQTGDRRNQSISYLAARRPSEGSAGTRSRSQAFFFVSVSFFAKKEMKSNNT